MRYCFVTSILITLFLSIDLQAQETLDRGTEIQFLNISIDDALKKSNAENKPIFLYVMMISGPCKKLEKGAFSDVELGKYYNEKFINVNFDLFGRNLTKEFIVKYEITTTPTLLYINLDGSLIHKFDGARTVFNFLSVAKQIYEEKVVEYVEEPKVNYQMKLPFKVENSRENETYTIEKKDTWVNIGKTMIQTDDIWDFEDLGFIYLYVRYINNSFEIKIESATTKSFYNLDITTQFLDHTNRKRIGDWGKFKVPSLKEGESKIFSTIAIPDGTMMFSVFLGYSNM